MSTELIIQLLIALVGGGALFKFLEKIYDRYSNRGKEQNDEWRSEIARLEKRTQDLESKVIHLEAEVEAWKGRTDEWRGKYQEVQAENTRLETELLVGSEEIERCRAALQRLRAAVSCPYVDNCPFLTGRLTPKEGSNEPGKST